MFSICMNGDSERAVIVVIIVEDETLIRMLLADALLDQGFDVIEAIHAGDAVAILKAEAGRIHALITDVNMPGPMDGFDLLHHTRAHWPWISLLATSGLAHAKVGAMPDGARFISKPYEMGNVIRHIREMRAAA